MDKVVVLAEARKRRRFGAAALSCEMFAGHRAEMTPDPTIGSGRYAPIGAVSIADWG